MDGVVGEVLGIVAVGMAAGDAEDALADQVRERVPNLLRRGSAPSRRRGRSTVTFQ